MEQELGLGGGRRGRDRASPAMLWGEAGLPELRGVVYCRLEGCGGNCCCRSTPGAGQTLGNASCLGLRCWAR